ncbi:MAG: RNA methyltransferase [Bdellovibrionaceae bacterium]|nr:RNA methyltransferase [Pseudobdellovibrionaceae bacterium]
MRIKRIDSPSNEIFKELAQLVTSKGIRKQKKCLISGDKIIGELVKKLPDESFFIYHSEKHELFDRFANKQVLVLKKDLYQELDVVGTNAPLLCSETPPLHNWEATSTTQETELLCALGDPANLGAVIRSACAFGVRRVILLEESANPFLPKVTKAASGCNFLMNFEKGPSIQDLNGVNDLVAMHMEGTPISDWKNTKPQRWLIGEEGLGVPRDLKCEKVSIPMMNDVESLNAAISASILLYEIYSSQKG